MPADDALLFIDTNKYLDLYRTDKGKKLLAPLAEQVEHIFVTQRVVDEVQRNKILVAAGFLDEKFKDLKLQTFNVPDHLSGTSAGQSKVILEQMSEIVQKIKKVNDEVNALALGILEQISRSEDEVSTSLAPIFAKAVAHTPDELQRARERRELGNPPGKSTNPIGDQLTWEQILTHFKGKKRLWIISRDGDYGTMYDGKGFLNRFLFEELRKVAPDSDVYLFADTVEGIKHFLDTTGVKAEKRLTPEEIKEIEKEEKALPNLTQPSDDFGRTMADIAKFVRPSEAFTQMADIAKFIQPNENLRQMVEMAKSFRPSDVFSQMADMAKFVQPSDELRQMIEMAKSFRPSDVFSQMADMAKFVQRSDELRQMIEMAKSFRPSDVFSHMADMATFVQPSEDFRQMVEVANSLRPSEAFSQMADIAKFAQPSEDFRQMVEMAKSFRPNESSTEIQEDYDEQPPTSPPSLQKGDNEKATTDGGEGG